MSEAYVGGASICSSTSITTPMMNDPTTFTNSELNGSAGPVTRMMAIPTRCRATEATKAPRADEQQLVHRMGRTPIGRAGGHPEPPHANCGDPEAATASARSLSVDSSAPNSVHRPRGRAIWHHANASSRGRVRMHAGRWSGRYAGAQSGYLDPWQQGTARQSPFQTVRRRPRTPAMCLIRSLVETLENRRSLHSGSHRAA
jgi:hypothetical protein